LLVQVFEKDGAWRFQLDKGDYPIVGVSWYGAKAYCEWTNRRLPTEAEWEYAARGTDGRRFPWGNEKIDCKYARYSGCGKSTVPVDDLPLGVSPFGIFNMAGNAAEWVNDRYTPDYYQTSPEQNPTGPNNGYNRVVRGGYWGDTYLALRTTRRDWAAADKHNNGIGFRCALTP
jgi:formylglycine-generating enzyme required for sulfatase activity